MIKTKVSIVNIDYHVILFSMFCQIVVSTRCCFVNWN